MLPGWYDEWVLRAAQHVRLASLQALEIMARLQLERGNTEAAVRAALRAVALDPLWDSARRMLVSVFSSRGQRVEALAEHKRSFQRLERELDVTPSYDLGELMREFGSERVAGSAHCRH
jgi:DNA-binding SARP family transcriptional activator